MIIINAEAFLRLYGIQFILILITLMATWFINKTIQKSFRMVTQKRNLPQGISFLIGKTIKFIIYSVGAITALKTINIEITPILASLGVGGLAVSFALKDALGNIISGVMVMLYRPFSVGDYIEFKTSSKEFGGKITGIDLRYTTLETESNKTLVPNSVIVSTPVVVKK